MEIDISKRLAEASDLISKDQGKELPQFFYRKDFYFEIKQQPALLPTKAPGAIQKKLETREAKEIALKWIREATQEDVTDGDISLFIEVRVKEKVKPKTIFLIEFRSLPRKLISSGPLTFGYAKIIINEEGVVCAKCEKKPYKLLD